MPVHIDDVGCAAGKRKGFIVFYKASEEGYKEVIPGIKLKTLVYGENTLFTEFRLEAGHVLPAHAHVYEQTGRLVKGHMRLTIGEDTFETRPGDTWCIPSNTPHSAVILEDSVAVEVFSPLREDYLPENL
jgi:quercetin dioxygenase-like cupin family protein